MVDRLNIPKELDRASGTGILKGGHFVAGFKLLKLCRSNYDIISDYCNVHVSPDYSKALSISYVHEIAGGVAYSITFYDLNNPESESIHIHALHHVLQAQSFEIGDNKKIYFYLSFSNNQDKENALDFFSQQLSLTEFVSQSHDAVFASMDWNRQFHAKL